MTQRIKVAGLPEFDAAPYWGSKAAVAAYLADILEANDPALLAANCLANGNRIWLQVDACTSK